MSSYCCAEQEALHFARSLRVDALADQQRTRLLLERDSRHRRRDFRRGRAVRPGFRRHRFHRFTQRGDVFRRRAATTADRIHAEITNERGEFAGQLLRRFGIDRFTERAHERQAGVRNDADEQRRVFAKIPDGIAHLRGAGGAIQSDDVDG